MEMKWLVLALCVAGVYSAKPIPKSEDEVATDVSMRPWLGTFEGCLIWNPECVRQSHNQSLVGYFLETIEDSATNESRCLQRASEYHGWCGNTMTNRTAAVFLETAAMEVYPPYGCAVYQRGCPNVVGTELEGIFMDDYDDAFMNETRCLQRALDYRVYCHPADSPETVAAYYAPTAKHFTVNLINDGLVDPNANADEFTSQEQIEVDVGTGKGHSIVLNSTVRALWTVSRSPPAFSATAVPLALFDLAGEYLDCHSPPMPIVDGRDKAKASRYHCNGPEAELAVEALSLFLSIHSQHADAHYNLGVAYYTLTELDLAISCFVAALKINPQHSMSMGALGTILTQQGKFEKAWELLDARVRPTHSIESSINDEMGEDGRSVGSDIVPKGVSPSVVMAWARLAPRFKQTQAAIHILENYIDYFHAETDPDDTMEEVVASEEEEEESTRHVSVDDGSTDQKKSIPTTIMSLSLRSRLEANLVFRLAQLLSQGHHFSKSWKSTLEANHLSRLAMDSERKEQQSVSGGGGGGGGGSSIVVSGSNCEGYECKNRMSSALALRQMSALRMAFCRKCIHHEIPTANKWRTVRTTSNHPLVYGPQDVRPIFVVGMPRSGTTLIEQMLGNHPQIQVAGEVPSLAVLAPRIFLNKTSDKPQAMVDPDLTEQDMELIGAQFLNVLRAHAKNGNRNKKDNDQDSTSPKYIVSKLPNHFELLGLIAKVFPNAPIIHTTRDVRDVILSNYQMNYQSGHHWSYNLTEAASYYAGYRSMMKHWEMVFKPPLPAGLSLPMMEIRYEDLVCGPSNVVKNLATFLGVSYEESMAYPHLSHRIAHTSSNEQVRRPVYTSSVGRWKQFSQSSFAPHSSEDGDDTSALSSLQIEKEAESFGDDLELLAQRLGYYPAQAILRRVLRFENFPMNKESNDPDSEEFVHDLVRFLPCRPNEHEHDDTDEWDVSRDAILRA